MNRYNGQIFGLALDERTGNALDQLCRLRYSVLSPVI